MRQQRLGQAEQIAHSLPMGGVAHAGANLGGEARPPITMALRRARAAS
jgi:hypothetical protein